MGEQEQVVEMVGAQDELEAKECEAVLDEYCLHVSFTFVSFIMTQFLY